VSESGGSAKKRVHWADKEPGSQLNFSATRLPRRAAVPRPDDIDEPETSDCRRLLRHTTYLARKTTCSNSWQAKAILDFAVPSTKGLPSFQKVYARAQGRDVGAAHPGASGGDESRGLGAATTAAWERQVDVPVPLWRIVLGA